MDINTIIPENIAALLARVVLGILFLFQGYDKVFRLKVSEVIKSVELQHQKTKLPHFLVAFGSYFTSYVELFGGLLLIFGFFKYTVLYLLAVDLVIAATGLSILNPLWDMRFFFPRLLLLLFLLFFPREYDSITLDHIIEKFL